MRFSRPSDRIAATWSLATGTAKSGYGVANLNTAIAGVDPSAALWIDETTIRVTADLGSPTEITMVAIFAHTCDAGLNLRFQMNSADSWGSPDVDEAFVIGSAYLNGYRPHVLLDLEAAIPSSAGRTYRWISIGNPAESNSVALAIGEIWLAGTSGWRQLIPYSLRPDYQQPEGHRVVAHESTKGGVQTVYDLGVRLTRGYRGRVRTTTSGLALLRSWEADTHGPVFPSVIALDPDSADAGLAEPRLVRAVFESAETLVHDEIYERGVRFAELGEGAPI
jgi:hypothetical protein